MISAEPKKMMEAFDERAFFKPSARLEMNAFLEKERQRQRDEGVIAEDADKLDLGAMKSFTVKRWQKIFYAVCGVVIVTMIVSAVIVSVMVAQGRDLPSFLDFLDM
mgnify:CR=1 FL=1